ncbi:hypothetical protein FGO68_gene7983 [Halteria grandinella]|uniref:Uncharacterized protein n=1 Tax=Halteria grandinella TaxID=5974 RepID=A0A8J8NQU0_HALGN|nr:hypothetical protein FGO68_gene7983 [Halteria grandinella]
MSIKEYLIILDKMRNLPPKLLLFLCSCSLLAALPGADRVYSLPWIGAITDFGLYSGYLPIPGTFKQLHYVTALSQSNWQTDPVIVWFNGGPGCSSMLGLFQEHGPYVQENGAQNFSANLWSWNKEASVVYIESPAGVGYSICPDEVECAFDDDNSAVDNLAAILQLMTSKFPELQKERVVYLR